MCLSNFSHETTKRRELQVDWVPSELNNELCSPRYCRILDGSYFKF